MAFRLISMEPGSGGGWQYWRPAGGGGVELGSVRGLDVALPTHFHDEDQITFVLHGRRHFVIGGQRVDVPSGEGIHIPAGRPHSSLSGSSDAEEDLTNLLVTGAV